jgi:NDP-sugar pyrophosphorylase family protein
MKKVAFILAGGKGQRLRPFTMTIPKPALPIAEMPIIGVVLSQLQKAGFERVYVSLGYKGYLIKAMISEELKPKMEIVYVEDTDFATGTAGALKLIREKVENVFVINGDILTDLNFEELWNYHCTSGNDATIALAQRSLKIDYGVVEITDDCLLHRFSEKPTMKSLVSMGINIVKGDKLHLIPDDAALDMPDLLLKIKDIGKVACHVHTGYWQDIGRIDDFEKANIDFAEDRSRFI